MHTTILLSFFFAAQAGAAQPKTCSAQDVKQLIATISADSMMGRAAGSRGDTLTTAYLTRVLAGAIGSVGAVSTQAVPLGSSSVTSRNIIATIPGSRDEWIVLTAHHDGLGIGTPDARGDSIYNGANDNAVGVALAICVAQSLQPAADRRGVIVILTGAEERGRLGSRYWAEHPTVDLAKVRFAVNLDAIGVTGPTQDFIAYGNGMLNGADSLLQSAGAKAGFELTTVSFESNMYWAFDSAELAAVGIPAITIGQGTRPPTGSPSPTPTGMPPMRQRYHSPADAIAEDWNFDAILRYGDLAASVVEAARKHRGSVELKSPNVYQKRP